MFKLSILVLTIWSIGMIYIVLKDHTKLHGRFVGLWLGVGVALFTLQTFLTFTYGQREHMFILLFLPGLVLRWCRWNEERLNPRLAVFLGIMAGIGAWIKPYFLLVVLAVEIYWLLVHRNLKPLVQPETIGFASIGLIYMVAFLAFPEIAKVLLAVVSESTANYLPRSSYTVFDVIKSYASQPELLILAAIGIVYPLSRKSLRSFMHALGVLVLAGMAIAIIQGYWGYRLLPAVTLASLIAVLVLADWLWPELAVRPPLSRIRWYQLAPKAIVLLLVVPLLVWWMTPNAEDARRKTVVDSDFHQLIRDTTQKGDRIAVLSYSISPFRTLAQTQRKLGFSDVMGDALRYGFDPTYVSDPRAPLSEMLIQYLDRLRRDLYRWKPELIAIDVTRNDFITLLKNRGIVQRDILPEYVYRGEFFDGDTTTLAVYQRIGPPPPMDLSLRFGQHVELVGWRLNGNSVVHPCEQITFDSWWKAVSQPDATYSMSLTLVDNGQGIANQDGPPAQIDTVDWLVGGQLADRRTLTIPCDIQPGTYALLVSMYDVNSLELLPITYPDGGYLGQYYYVTDEIVEGAAP